MDSSGNTPSATDEQRELETLRERVAALERENAEMARRTNAAVAEAQERVYWLDRWHVDLNALMRRRGASEVRAALRAVRRIARAVKKARARTARAPRRR